ncbi:MAG TPA: SRPBCC family protein [Candidatus Lustribacter sp.]|nr:SRPBCC family protein [Candidatus Lustribacter sp.]
MADVRETLLIDASPLAVYALVADLPRMGEWSPECERVVWRGGATHAVKGARFFGYNRVGRVRWFTYGEVVAADPGRNLAFEITFGPMRVSRWEYYFLPHQDGTCTLAEEWTDRRPTWFRVPATKALGSRTRANTRGIHRTLQAVKLVAEGSPDVG